MSTPVVPTLYHVALMGFSGFEHQALDSYLELARARTPAYAPCTAIEDAQFVIANGDRAGVLDLLSAAQRVGDTLLVGVTAAPGVAACLKRPIDPLELFRTLDDAVKRRSLAATAASASPRHVTMAEIATPWAPADPHRRAAFYAPAGRRVGELQNLSRGLGPAGRARRAPVETTVIEALAEQPLPTATSRHDTPRHGTAAARGIDLPSTAVRVLDALVIDASATPTFVSLLEAHHIKPTCVERARQAFAMLEAFPFDMILIDAQADPRDDLDGLQVCLAIRRLPRPSGEACPPIVLMSAMPSPLEEARSALAGSRAYVGKPIEGAALERALVQAGLRSAPEGQGAAEPNEGTDESTSEGADELTD